MPRHHRQARPPFVATVISSGPGLLRLAHPGQRGRRGIAHVCGARRGVRVRGLDRLDGRAHFLDGFLRLARGPPAGRATTTSLDKIGVGVVHMVTRVTIEVEGAARTLRSP